MNDLTYDFLESELGNSFYKELYHLNDSDNIVVLEESTGNLYVRKVLKYYDIRVYEYLKNHPDPSIPLIKEYYEAGDRLVVYEEFIAGKTLDEYAKIVSDRKDLERVILKVCDCLEFLHNANPSIIHRDIKPANIMVSNDGVVKLIDYDAAKVVNPDSNRDTVLLGSEGFSAPEQYGFGSSSIRTDIYAMGKLVSEIFPDDKKYKTVINKATHIDPDKRYSNISSFKRAFKNPEFSRISIPGFRGDNVYHNLRSLAGYIFIIWIVSGITLQGESQRGVWVYRIMIFLMVVAWIDMLSGVSPVFTKFPLLRNRNIAINIIGFALYGFISFFLTLILSGLIVSLIVP